MVSLNFGSFPPEIQRQIIGELSSDDLFRFVRAYDKSPQPLKGVFQLITNHNNPSVWFELETATLPRIKLEDYDPSKDRALINIVELVDFYHIDQKKLCSQISHTMNFIYIVRDINRKRRRPDDEQSDIEDNSDDDYEELGPYAHEIDYMEPSKVRLRLQTRFRTFFERFLPFSKLFFDEYDMTIDLARCPDLTNVTIFSARKVALQNRSTKGLPVLMDVIALELTDPIKEALDKYGGEPNEGVLETLTVGDDGDNEPVFGLEGQSIEVESCLTLFHVHTLKLSQFSSKSVEIWFCNRPSGEPPLIENFLLSPRCQRLSLHLYHQPPLLSSIIFISSIDTLEISQWTTEGSFEQLSTFIKAILSHAMYLKTLKIKGSLPLNVILSNRSITSTSLESLSLTLHDEKESIETMCASFPNLRSLSIGCYHRPANSCPMWIPKVLAPDVESLSITANPECSRERLADFIKQYPNTKYFEFETGEASKEFYSCNFKELILSPISSKLVRLKLRGVWLNFMIGEDAIEFPELVELNIEDWVVYTDPDGPYPGFELNLKAPKLETLTCDVTTTGPMIIKDLPSLKAFSTRNELSLIVLENLQELKTVMGTQYFIEEVRGRNLPKLEVVQLPRWRKDRSTVLDFDETVNSSFRLIEPRPIF